MTAANSAEGLDPDRVPLAVIVPSRGRPRNIVELIEAFQRTRFYPSTKLVVVVDEDDPTLDDYWAACVARVGLLIAPAGGRLGGALNFAAASVAKWTDLDVIGFMGDDHRPRTVGWDQRIVEAMPRNGVVYGNDLIQGRLLPTAVFMDARIVRALGHFVLPRQIHLFMDNYWKTLGEQLGTLTYLDDVIIEHCHPIAGKAEWDEGYVRNNGGDVWTHDEAIYKDWAAYQVQRDVEAVRAYA